MSRDRYDLLLLDFGGVCLLNPAEMHTLAEERLGLPAGTFTWLGPVDPSTDELYRELCGGEQLQEREYWARRAADVGSAAGRTMTLHEYMDLLYVPAGDHLVRPGCFTVVAGARAAGFGVSVLTNDLGAFHGPDWKNGISLFDSIDHLVDCSDTGILKPDPRAFQRAVDITGVAPDRILFVDDQPISVQGAADVGIEAMWFDISSPAASWQAVADRLGIGTTAV